MAEAFLIAWNERGLRLRFLSLVMAGLAAAVGLIIAYKSPGASLAGPFAATAIAVVAVWMLSSTRTHLTLAALMLYLGLADGVIKLMTNSSAATLGRDLLLYSIVVGLLVKRAVNKEPSVYPPLSGWVVALVALVVIQVFNPADVGTSHSVASMRPHLEFIPLFFLGYTVVRSRARLKAFLMLLIAIAAINGAVSLVQFQLSPNQMASWGPGYAARINGTNGVSPRGFTDNTGKKHTRPFGLGSDMGFGGALGLLAAPAAFALLSLARNNKLKVAAGLMSVGVVMAVVTSQARVAVVGTVAAIIAFLLLASSSRRMFRLLSGLGLGLAIAYLGIATLAAHTSSHLFDRYKTITPGSVFSTTYNYRQGTLQQIPQYMGKFPLGAGIGKVGPAANSAGGNASANLDAESEPTYLLIELGIPGLVILMGFQIRILQASLRIRRLKELELRLLLGAVAAPLFAEFVAGIVGITTSSTPGSPYLWFSGGILSYWLITARHERHDARH